MTTNKGQKINITTDNEQLTTDNRQPLIQLCDIGLVYRSAHREVEALWNINLEFQSGDFVCVIGSSGCGKTSLLRVIAGYDRPTSGTITVAGKAHTKPDADVGVVFQHPNLFPWLTIEKNVEFGPKMKGVPKSRRMESVTRYLEMVGLSRSAKMLPHQLSGGMKQRAAIARALAADPKVILMDEPFGALDALTRESMQVHLHEIWQQTHKSIFFITHDVEEALLLATRILVMHSSPGRIVKEMVNPFARQLGNTKASQLRLSKEFVEMRESLVFSIREGQL